MSATKTLTVKVMGAEAELLDGTTAATVKEAMAELGLEGSYTVSINGRPATMDTVVENGAFIVLSPAVKGA